VEDTYAVFSDEHGAVTARNMQAINDRLGEVGKLVFLDMFEGVLNSYGQVHKSYFYERMLLYADGQLDEVHAGKAARGGDDPKASRLHLKSLVEVREFDSFAPSVFPPPPPRLFFSLGFFGAFFLVAGQIEGLTT